MGDYIKKIRQKIGNEKFIHPGARIIVENKNNEILIIERADNGNFGLPAGAIEENETIEECIIREVLEETGIQIISLEVIGISSNPVRETVEYKNGDKIQYFTVEFYSNDWRGEIKSTQDDEVKRSKFISREDLPPLPINESSAFESLAYFRKYKKVMLK
jgi:ADP-ribose pyrophosphatase YjhB (NUDIX family)